MTKTIDFTKPIQLLRPAIGVWENISEVVPVVSTVAFFRRNDALYWKAFSNGHVEGAPHWSIRNRPAEPVVHKRWMLWLNVENSIIGTTLSTATSAKEYTVGENYYGYKVLAVQECRYVEPTKD